MGTQLKEKGLCYKTVIVDLNNICTFISYRGRSVLTTPKVCNSFFEPHQTYPMFLDGHISEVHKHVVQFAGAGCVLHCAEPAKAQLVPES